MKKRLKPVSCFTMFFALFLMLFMVRPVKSYAYNPDFNATEASQVNTVFQTNVSNGNRDEYRMYRFTILENGFVKIRFEAPLQGHSKTTWDYYLYNSNYDEITKQSIYGNQSTVYSDQYGLAQGDYYLCICSSNYYNATSTDILTVNIMFTASEFWEREFNDNYNTADDIKTNTGYYGITPLGGRDEKDYYKFTLDRPGYIRAHIHHNQNGTTKKVYQYRLIDGSYNEFFSGDTYGNYEDTYTPYLGVDKGTYYFEIESANYYSAVSNDTYQFDIAYQASNNWEIEYNGDFNSADTTNLGETYYGTCIAGSRDEKDYFTFNVPSYGVYRFTVNTAKQSESSPYWHVYLYDSKYEELTDFTTPGNQTKTTWDFTLSTGKYYLLMQSANYYNSSTDIYSFMITPKPMATLLSAAKTKTRYYVGDTVSTNDINVTARLSDGTVQDVSWLCTISNGVNTKKAGSYKITISYEGKITSITIKVVERPLKKGDKSTVKVGKTTFTYKITGTNTVMLYSVSSGKKNLEKMTVPATVKLKKKSYKVTAIGSKAFSGCTSMKSLIIGKNVKMIGSSAVTGCKKLKTITVNTSLLTKKSVSASLKGSCVKTVKTSKGNLSKYKKIFTKANTKSRYVLSVKK